MVTTRNVKEAAFFLFAFVCKQERAYRVKKKISKHDFTVFVWMLDNATLAEETDHNDLGPLLWYERSALSS